MEKIKDFIYDKNDLLVALLQCDDGLVQKTDAQLLTEGVENGSHQQGAEEALGHSAEGINAVALQGNDDVFAVEELTDFVHGCFTCFRYFG